MDGLSSFLRCVRHKIILFWSDRWQKKPRQATRAGFYHLLTSPTWPLFFFFSFYSSRDIVALG